jgi:hypothetical protein
MSITIKNKDGKTVLHRVARTSRGFNRKQRQEIAAVRLALALDPTWTRDKMKEAS